MSSIEIIPTVVPHSLDDVSAVIRRFESFASAVHIDAGDGIFVQNKTWFPLFGDTIPRSDEIFFEAHLMVEEPRKQGIAFIEAGCKRIIAHVEAFASTEETRGAMDAWKERGAEAGLAVLIDTPLEVLEPLIPACDEVLVMSIATLGKQGAPYDARAVPRIFELHRTYPNLRIAVDGGVSGENIASLVKAGATRFSIGSAISKSADPASAYRHLLSLAESV